MKLGLDLNLLGLASTSLQEMKWMLKWFGLFEFQSQNRSEIETRFSIENLQVYPLMVKGRVAGSKLGKGLYNSEHEAIYL